MKTITAYGPANLIDHLKKKRWSNCIPDGQNFDAVSVKDPKEKQDLKACICRPADEHAPDQIKFRVEGASSLDFFEVEGFCSRTFGMLLGSYKAKALLLDGSTLSGRKNKENPVRYRVIVS